MLDRRLQRLISPPIARRRLRRLGLGALAPSVLAACLFGARASAEDLPPRPEPVVTAPGACQHTMEEVADALSGGLSLGDGAVVGYSEFGAFDQIDVTSTVPGGCVGATFPTDGSSYVALSTGTGRRSLDASTNAFFGLCDYDPDYGALCDGAGFTLDLHLDPGATLLGFDYRYFTWDYHPGGGFEDPFRVTVYPQVGPPVTVLDTNLTCELFTKGLGLGCGDEREAMIDVSPWAGQTIQLVFSIADQYDGVVDTGVVIDNLHVGAGGSGSGGGGVVLPSCAGSCLDLEGCGYGYDAGCSYGGDGICDDFDNCPFDFNPGQSDCDENGIGDACDNDSDGDARPDGCDVCPFDFDPDQIDCNGDGVGDICDPVSTCNPPILQSFFLQRQIAPNGVGANAVVGEGTVEIRMEGVHLHSDILVSLVSPSTTLAGILLETDLKGNVARALFDLSGAAPGAYDLTVTRLGQSGVAAQKVEVWPSLPNVRASLHPAPQSPGRTATNVWSFTNNGTLDAVTVLALQGPAPFLPQPVSSSPTGSFFGGSDVKLVHTEGRVRVVAVFVPKNGARTLQTPYYWPASALATGLESFCLGDLACKQANIADPQWGVVTGEKIPIGWEVEFNDMTIGTLTVAEWQTVENLPVASLLAQTYDTDRGHVLSGLQQAFLIKPNMPPEEAALVNEHIAFYTQSTYARFKSVVANRLPLP